MNQKLSDWASIAEIVSGIAVVVTLVFLLLGIRENTDVTRVSVYSSLLDSLNAIEQTIIADEELSRMYIEFVSGAGAGLNDTDKRRLMLIVLGNFRNYEKAFFSERYDVISDIEWSRFETVICLNFERGLGIGLDVRENLVLNDDFRRYIANTCAESAN